MKYQGIPGEFKDSTPFNQMHFWDWANAQEKRNNVTIGGYLSSLGFVLWKDKLTPEEHTRLDYAVDAWHRTTPHIRELQNFNNLFIEVPDDGGFFVFSKPNKYYPSQVVIDALYDAGWIYNVTPETTYFEVIRGRLYAKYQQIIGSRYIADIKA